MSEKNTGGLAFPFTPTDRSGQIGPSDPGMTLRDYFVASAPFTLADAVQAADLESMSVSIEVAVCRVLMDPAKRAIAMKTLAALRNEYADSILEAREE